MGTVEFHLARRSFTLSPMSDSESNIEEWVVDLQNVDLTDLATMLTPFVGSGKKISLTSPDRRDHVGIRHGFDGALRVAGDLGDYCFMANQNAQVEVEGDVGHAFGHLQQSGSLVVHGTAEDAVGCFCQGGWIAIYGTAGIRAGAAMENGELIIRGNVGNEAGYRMRGGVLVIGGSAGKELGKDLEAGTIFVRGDVASLAEEIEEFRLKESDRFKLGLLMLKAGIKASGKDFRGYRKIPS